MIGKDLSTKAANGANPALPAQEKEQLPITKEFLSRLVGMAVGATLHNFRLDRRRRFSGRAFRLARAFFRAAAQQTENGVSPEVSVSAAQFRRIAEQKFGPTKEGTISADVSLLNELADTDTAKGGFLSPLLATEKGKFRVRLILLAEHRDHIFAYEVTDANDTLIVRHDDELRVSVGSKVEDALFDEIKRNPVLLHRVATYLAKGVAAALVLVLIYVILPDRAQAAIRDFARYIVSPIKRLLTGEGTSAGSKVNVSEAPDVPPSRIVEERPHLRLTPAMYWGVHSSITVSASAVCDGPTPLVFVHLDAPDVVQPPFVVIRNGIVLRDNVMEKKVEFRDTTALPGRSYTYTLGKRDAATGDVVIGRIAGASTPFCPAPPPSNNRPPVLTLSVDPSSGTAPLKATFTVSATDDEDQVKPFIFNFGDTTYSVASRSPRVTHEYRYGGTYTPKVTLADRVDNVVEASTSVTVEGPPPPAPLTKGAQNPWEYWHGDYYAKASPVVGDVDEPFTIEVMPEFIVGHNPYVPAISYQWTFADCLEREAPFNGPNAKVNKDCLWGPYKEPRITKRFDEPGSYEVNVFVTYANGDTAYYGLGMVTALPTEKWLATHPVDDHRRMHLEQMREAARYYTSRVPDLTTPP
ncbi:MAG TPA: PKD domain-containing protein [Thermoanaerobaculia bacterium]|nr:PKD domain-containing protein [Thermoanaerobaculia bacterium]